MVYVQNGNIGAPVLTDSINLSAFISVKMTDDMNKQILRVPVPHFRAAARLWQLEIVDKYITPGIMLHLNAVRMDRKFSCFTIICAAAIFWNKAVAGVEKYDNQRHLVTTNSTTDQCALKLALVLCDEKTKSDRNNFERQINQTLVLIKSVLITLEKGSCVHVILITNKKDHFERIERKIFTNPGNWDVSFTRRLQLEFVNLEYPASLNWMRNTSRNRPCTTFRLFLPDFLPQYDAVILCDTDLIFLRSLTDLWAEMSDFTTSALAGLVPHLYYSPKPRLVPYYKHLGFTTGVMLLNLTRMRLSNWTQKVLLVSEPYLAKIEAGLAEEV